MTLGFWVLIGMLSFLLVEKIITETESADFGGDGSEQVVTSAAIPNGRSAAGGGRNKGQRSRLVRTVAFRAIKFKKKTH